MIYLDGSYLEGGGQIIRTALALSTLLKKPFEIDNIRAGRKSPGLKNQHLYCISALKQLCNAKEDGAELGTKRLKYCPGEIKAKNLSIDIGTAGSITLLLQCIILPCMFSGKRIKIEVNGGTDVAWSPQATYFEQVILPQLRRYADIDFRLVKRGYYPRGGGRIELVIKPKFSFEQRELLPKINLAQQKSLLQIKGLSHASIDLEYAEVAERQAKAAEISLSKLKCPVQISTEYSNTSSIGSGITLWAIFGCEEGIEFDNPVRLGADVLGERGKRAESVGQQCASQLIREIELNAAVDKHLCDNLMPYMALSSGNMLKTSEITMHTKTNMWVCEEFLGKIFNLCGCEISTKSL